MNRLTWSAGVYGAVVLGCLGLACLEPLVAIAVLAAARLRLPQALALTAAVWLTGQAIGFGLRDYPVDVQTVGWGAGLGVMALASLVTAAVVLPRLPQHWPTAFRVATAFVPAFVANQLTALAVEFAVEGSCEIVPGVITAIGLINAGWLAALLALDALAQRRPAARAA
ncbi:hypothetical protein LRS10_13025 [Phenylobacterium sp. J426]|uniref:hypothetical protein n=1 Tax=Phenylobacterium sp. J426 TaxID=2898439 RepID=UPI0021513435|nr:hypothetical protein [Phenylobacterium sp. J426]MCR5875020.1 hypothetical protein [Phenylobacterium sp. J426]